MTDRGAAAATSAAYPCFNSLREEVANCLSHGLGLALSVVGAAVLIALAGIRDHPPASHVVGCCVFGGSLVALYGASTCYHAARHARLREVLRLVDHLCIYLLIAGSYTPWTITYLRGPWGWTLFGLVWGLAAFGLIFKLGFGTRFPVVSTAIYIAMGWLALVAMGPLIRSLPPGAFAWILAGGLAYTGGVVFYALDRIPYFHTVWHVFVLAGSLCHYVAVMRYVALGA